MHVQPQHIFLRPSLLQDVFWISSKTAWLISLCDAFFCGTFPPTDSFKQVMSQATPAAGKAEC